MYFMSIIWVLLNSTLIQCIDGPAASLQQATLQQAPAPPAPLSPSPHKDGHPEKEYQSQNIKQITDIYYDNLKYWYQDMIIMDFNTGLLVHNLYVAWLLCELLQCVHKIWSVNLAGLSSHWVGITYPELVFIGTVLAMVEEKHILGDFRKRDCGERANGVLNQICFNQ